MTGSSRVCALVVLAFLGSAATAPALDAQRTSSGERIQYALVVAEDYAFQTPPTIGEGIITFHLVNRGSDVHHLMLLELGAGHTIKNFLDAVRATGQPPVWTATAGMTPTIQPNSEAFLTLRLAPGRYILSCMLPARDGRSHVDKGMYQFVTVTRRPAVPTKAVPAKKP